MPKPLGTVNNPIHTADVAAVPSSSQQLGSANNPVHIAGGGGGGGVSSFNTRTGAVTSQSGDYTKAQVGLGSADDTSDANKPVSTAQAAAIAAATTYTTLNDALTTPVQRVLGKDVSGNKVLLDGNAVRRMSTDFTPSDFASCKAWIDFSEYSTVTAASNLISAVTDLSGNGSTLVQATGGSKPTHNPYGGPKDKGYATFVAGKTLTLASFAKSQPFTVFMVMKLKTFVNQGVILEVGASYTHGIAQKSIASAGVTLEGVFPVAGAGWGGSVHPGYFQNKWVVMGFVFNGASSQVMTSGVFQFPNANPGTDGSTKLQIGSSSSCDFDCGEVLFFDEALTEGKCRKVDDYLHAKWGVDPITTYLAVGDSITFGYYATTAYVNGYAWRTAQEKGYQIINIAVPSTTHAYARSVLSKYLDHLPRNTVISIMEGSNDGPQPVHMEAIVAKIRDAGFNMALVYLFPPPYYSTSVAQNTTIMAYLTTIAATYGCNVVDILTPMLAGGGDALMPDTIHPVDIGHGIIKTTFVSLLP